jgi:hypothetical protein
VDYRIEIGLGIVVAIVSFGLNRQFAQVCSDFQKSVFGLDYPLRNYRIPLYFVGAVFIVIIVGRLFAW